MQQRELTRELFRMDRVLEAPPPPPPPRPEPTRDLGPVVSSGGHPQPTPAEIERRMAERQKRAERAGVELRPVFDLFGERIQ